MSKAKAVTFEASTEQATAQVNNSHYSPDEPWKKHWVIGASFFMQSKFTEAEPELTEELKLAKDSGYTDV